MSRIKIHLFKIILSENFVLYLSIIFFLILLPFVPRIASIRNLTNLSSNIWPLFVLVIGQMFVLILGGIDLSQTSIMAITSVIGAMLMTSYLDPLLFSKNPLWGTILSEQGGLLAENSWATSMGILIMLSSGAFIGLLNGVAVAKFKMPPFMVTLISMIFFSGLAIYLTQSENITHLPVSFIKVGKSSVGFLPISFFIAVGLAFFSHFVLTKTVLGRWIFAVGFNIKTALISGIPTERVIITGYIISGFFAALASILYSARLEGGRPTLGQNQLLDIIGAAVIGGISLFGGKGKVTWAFYGVLFFTLLANALNMLNLSFFTINIVKGSVILLAAVIDGTRSRIAFKG
jgi:ribose/xylose/arabinose/galactoside ABC-type transport system permease subunit